ncbi:ribokinase [Paludicola sp. MB14-C6]|uniref:ribokinase n=1 Tax=Paludihabitans sp. MB14-C6 TaxID=3070656 RepID=UPI0027DC79B6|nr:ribokinase [Paludicola sp. MB14-C6]WMJ24113.1 ribokinase [Paludicola sp. MB14-C6]
MRVLNFGSLNIDYVYQVDHFVRPAETISSHVMERFCGGKGLNQSIALSRAGAAVCHAGCIGSDGLFLKEQLEQSKVDTKYVRQVGEPTGHAIIQVDKNGQNCILLYGGANQCITKQQVDDTLKGFSEGDLLLLQNEVNQLEYIIDQASKKGMQIAFNPSPFDRNIVSLPLNKVNIFLLNEIEGAELSNELSPQAIIEKLKIRYPSAKIVLTLGKDGVYYYDGSQVYFQSIFSVPIVDTTAAGDTFTGYFLQGLTQNVESSMLLKRASAAAALAVSKMGAAPSIPTITEVNQFLSK